MSGRCAVVQPNYIPWKGYFDLISAVDHFVLLDNVQYTTRDWRNRNRAKTPQGLIWLTIPVSAGERSRLISEVKVADAEWSVRHLEIWRRNYARAGGAIEMLPLIAEWYGSVSSDGLADVCAHFIRRVSEFLGIATPLYRASEMDTPAGANERLIGLCQELGCDTYVSGPAAKSYLDENQFRAAGIEVHWFDYSGYPEYPQPHPPFEHRVSILDLLICTGDSARAFLHRAAPTAIPA